jgi:hypothetical protein
MLDMATGYQSGNQSFEIRVQRQVGGFVDLWPEGFSKKDCSSIVVDWSRTTERWDRLPNPAWKACRRLLRDPAQLTRDQGIRLMWLHVSATVIHLKRVRKIGKSYF